MRSVQQAPPLTSISLLTANKQIRFLETLKRSCFSGQLVFASSKEERWIFYFYQGRILYAMGGLHSARRWQRNLKTYCPQMLSSCSVFNRDLAAVKATASKLCWEYKLLNLWVARQKITSEQAAKIIHSAIAEVLFEVAQAMRVIHQIEQDSSLPEPLIAVDMHKAIAQIQQLWQVWRNPQLTAHSPNSAPIIKQPEELRRRTSEPVYQALSRLLDGQHTLRDLAVQMKQDIVPVTRSLLPYIQMGLVELVNIPDLPSPVDTIVPETPLASPEPTEPLIACVDDSPLVLQTMEALLVAAGYRFLGVDNPMRAFSVLLARKPNLIFLDLVMPNTNGYEICGQLRKLSGFRQTPIVILTGNDGIVDRVRAKLVGASDFLSKPIDAGIVLSVLHKHLKQGAISY